MEELPVDASETTAGEFREHITRFELKMKGKERIGGERRKEPRHHGPPRKLEAKYPLFSFRARPTSSIPRSLHTMIVRDYHRYAQG